MTTTVESTIHAANVTTSRARTKVQDTIAGKIAQMLEAEAELQKMKRQIATAKKEMFDTSNTASAATHTKIVLGAAIMALAMADDAKEGSLAHRIREYLDRTMPRNRDRELFRLPSLDAKQIKSVREERQLRIDEALGAAQKQAEQLYADKKSRQGQLSKTKNNAGTQSQQLDDVNTASEDQTSFDFGEPLAPAVM